MVESRNCFQTSLAMPRLRTSIQFIVDLSNTSLFPTLKSIRQMITATNIQDTLLLNFSIYNANRPSLEYVKMQYTVHVVMQRKNVIKAQQERITNLNPSKRYGSYFDYLPHRDKIFCIYSYFKQSQLMPFSLRHTVKGYVCHILSFSIWHAQYSKWATYHFIFHRMQYPNLLALIVAKFIQFLDREKEISFCNVL